MVAKSMTIPPFPVSLQTTSRSVTQYIDVLNKYSQEKEKEKKEEEEEDKINM